MDNYYKSRYSNFSKMDWLEDEIKRNSKSAGRNEISDWYYNTLLKIKNAQANNTITTKLYKELAFCSDETAIAYGYYTANIHYDLFTSETDKDELEQRIIEFIQITGDELLRKSSWFMLNFINDFKNFLLMEDSLNLGNTEISEWIMKNGNDKEKKILKLFENLKNRLC